MRIQSPAAYLVAARLGVGHFTQTCQQRTNEHNRTAQFVALLQEIRTTQVIGIQIARREGKPAFSLLLDLDAH